MNVKNFGTTKVPILGLPLESPWKNYHLDVAPIESHRVYYRERSDASYQKLQVI